MQWSLYWYMYVINYQFEYICSVSLWSVLSRHLDTLGQFILSFLARLVILIKKSGPLQLKSALTFTCWRDTWKVFLVSFPNVLCMSRVTSSRTSSIMTWKKSKWLIYCNFSHFTSIIWPCERDNMESFSCILPKFVMHILQMTSSTSIHLHPLQVEACSGWRLQC